MKQFGQELWEARTVIAAWLTLSVLMIGTAWIVGQLL